MAGSNPAQDSFLLGEIKATVTGTADDVKAIRLDLGDLAKRLSSVETRVEAIEAERSVQVPQYNNFRHTTNNELQKLIAWQNKQEGALFGGSLVGKLVFAALGMMGGIGGWAALQAVAHPAQRPAVTQTVVAQAPAQPR